jgi:hypothetical protein
MTPEQGERDLEVLLSYLLNRQLRKGEIIEALGISRSTFYDQREQGQLANPKNLLAAARFFGLNPVELLLRYGHITADEVINLSDELTANPSLLTRTGVSQPTEDDNVANSPPL